MAVRDVRSGPRRSRCVLLEISVPAGINLYPGTVIALTV